jgi:hypothetical protein
MFCGLAVFEDIGYFVIFVKKPMRHIISAFIILFALSLYSCGDRSSSGTKSEKSGTIKKDSLVFHDTLYQDTFFIYRYSDSAYYRGVYLSKAKENSEDYRQLLNFNLDSSDKNNLKEDCKYASDSMKLMIKKLDLFGLPADWTPLVQYKNKYYLYPGVLDRKILADSMFIFETQDGYHGSVLQSVTKENANEYRFEYKDIIEEDRKTITGIATNIYILNPKTMLTVWETIADGIHKFELRIPKESAKYYDLIEDHSTDETDDYKFEKIDFKRLIRESQSHKE